MRSADMLPLLEEQLAAGKNVRFSPTGESMLPLLRQGVDTVELSPAIGTLKCYDVILYRRPNGKYVLHRIVNAGDTYTCIGDAQFVLERGVTREQVLGVVTCIHRDGKAIPVTDPAYRLWCRVWKCTRPLRHLWHRLTK